MTVKGIEVTGTIYDNEDETARSTATEAASTARTASRTATTASETATTASETATTASETATQADAKIGDLADLETTVKTNLVSAINEVNATESLDNININLRQSGSADKAILTSVARAGHVYTFMLTFQNIDFTTIGTVRSEVIGTVPLRPLKKTYAVGIDYINTAFVRSSIDTDGTVKIEESVGVVKGSNEIRAPYTLIV